MQVRKIGYLVFSALLCVSMSGTPASAQQQAEAKSSKADKGGAAAAAPAKLEATIDNSTSTTVKAGEQATVAIKTAAGSKGTITVKLKSGASKNADLKQLTAGNDGMLKWTWTVAKNTSPGPISWTVDVKNKDEKAQAAGKIEVQKAEGAAASKTESKTESKSTKTESKTKKK